MEEVRLWLADLATDLRAALAEGALPPLSMDRVWITSAGRARLLDWGAVVDSPPMVQGTSDVQIGRAQRFLFDVARAGLRAGSSMSDAGLSVPCLFGRERSWRGSSAGASRTSKPSRMKPRY